MLRSQVITGIKARLDEFTPFEEPRQLIALPQKDVKPMDAVIEQVLAKAADNVLMAVPSSMIEMTVTDITGQANGHQAYGGGPVISRMAGDEEVGLLKVPNDYLRIHTVMFDGWRRMVHNAYSGESAMYAMQRNPYTRGRSERPCVVVNDGRFEIYSLMFRNDDGLDHCMEFRYVPMTGDACTDFEDRVAGLIILEAAKQVLEIFGNQNGAKAVAEEEKAWMELNIQ